MRDYKKSQIIYDNDEKEWTGIEKQEGTMGPSLFFISFFIRERIEHKGRSVKVLYKVDLTKVLSYFSA